MWCIEALSALVNLENCERILATLNLLKLILSTLLILHNVPSGSAHTQLQHYIAA